MFPPPSTTAPRRSRARWAWAGMAPLKLLQTRQLKALLRSRRPHHLNFTLWLLPTAIPRETDQGTNAEWICRSNPVRADLDLRSLISILDRSQNAAQTLNGPEFLENGLLQMRSITFIPGDPAKTFIICRNSPDSSRMMDCACDASRLHSSLGW